MPRCSTEITSLRAIGTLPHPCYQTNKTLASTRFGKLSPDKLLGVIPIKLGSSLLPAEIPLESTRVVTDLKELCNPQTAFCTSLVMLPGAPAELSWCFDSGYSAPAFVELHKESASQARGITHKTLLLLAEFRDCFRAASPRMVVQPFCLTSVQ